MTPMLPANGWPWFCQSFHGHCSPPFFVVNAAFWTIKPHSTSTPHSSTRVLYFSGWMPHELHNFKRGCNQLGSSSIFRHGFCASFEAITVWMPSSKASAWHVPVVGLVDSWTGKPPKVENKRVYRRLYGEVYTVDGYLSDVCLYQYLERDQTKRERIIIKCERKYAWLKVPLILKKPAKQWHMVV